MYSAPKHLTKRFEELTGAGGFDPRQDFYRQEIPYILNLNADKPGFTLYELIQEHCRLRGFGGPLGQRPEHDATHVILGLIFDQNLRSGALKPEDHMDFQTGHYTEVFTNDIEKKISPNGILATWHKKNPDAFMVSPYHPDIAQIASSAENEENYMKSLSWIIGGRTGHRAANIRYVYGNLDSQPELEKIVKSLGYEIAFNKGADFTPVNWSVTAPNGTIYSCSALGNCTLPQGSNGVEEFRPVKFPDAAKIEALYEQIDPIIDHIHQRREETIDKTLKSITVAEIIAVINGPKPTSPRISRAQPRGNDLR